MEARGGKKECTRKISVQRVSLLLVKMKVERIREKMTTRRRERKKEAEWRGKMMPHVAKTVTGWWVRVKYQEQAERVNRPTGLSKKKDQRGSEEDRKIEKQSIVNSGAGKYCKVWEEEWEKMPRRSYFCYFNSFFSCPALTAFFPPLTLFTENCYSLEWKVARWDSEWRVVKR